MWNDGRARKHAHQLPSACMVAVVWIALTSDPISGARQQARSAEPYKPHRP